LFLTAAEDALVIECKVTVAKAASVIKEEIRVTENEMTLYEMNDTSTCKMINPSVDHAYASYDVLPVSPYHGDRHKRLASTIRMAKMKLVIGDN